MKGSQYIPYIAFVAAVLIHYFLFSITALTLPLTSIKNPPLFNFLGNILSTAETSAYYLSKQNKSGEKAHVPLHLFLNNNQSDGFQTQPLGKPNLISRYPNKAVKLTANIPMDLQFPENHDDNQAPAQNNSANPDESY